jgi:hypothetical protein
MAAKQRCPKCNSLNDLNAAACVQCSAPLVQVCPICGAVRPWYVARCSRCEHPEQDGTAFARLFQAGVSGPIRGRYIVRETLHTTGVSAVYRTVDANNPSQTYVVKEYSTLALFVAKEKREVLTAFTAHADRWARLQHPAIPTIVDRFEASDKQYLVCEHVDGLSLAQIIEHPQMRVRPELARNIGDQLCDLLAFLHGQADPIFAPFLSPRHLMIDSDGQIRLVGLGLGRLFGNRAYGPYGSTRGYGAPELASVPPTAQSDFYAVGRLLFAALVDRMLEKGVGRSLTLRQAVPDITQDLVRAVGAAVRRAPERRFAAAAEMARALGLPPGAPVQPMPDWLQQVAVAVFQPTVALAPNQPHESAARSESGPNMESYGFRRDPRFGRRPDQAAAPVSPMPAAAEPSPSEATAQLSVYPLTLNLGELGDEDKRVALTLRNAGQTELSGRVVSQVDWIKAPSRLIRLPAGKQAKVLLKVSPGQLPIGEMREPQALLVDTDAGRRWVGAVASIRPGPVLAFEPAILAFGQFPSHRTPTATCTVSNVGRAPLSGQIVSDVAWIGVRRPALRCAAGDSVQVAVTLDPTKMPVGPQSLVDAIRIDSDGGQGRIGLQAHCLRPQLDVGTHHMDLGEARPGEVLERYLYVGNTGDGLLQGTVHALVPWLQALPRTFECPPGDMVQITVTADCTGLADGLLDEPQAIRIQSNGGSLTLSQRLHISAPNVSVQPTTIDFGAVTHGQSIKARLELKNNGSAPAAVALSPLVAWLAVDRDAFTCEPGQAVAVNLTANTAGFERGATVALTPALAVHAGAQVLQVHAGLIIIKPTLVVDPERVDFGYADPAQPEARLLTLTNSGTGTLAWNTQSAAPWIEVAPQEGRLQPGEHVELRLAAYALGLEAGVTQTEATLIINSDGGRAKVPLRLALAEPMLAVDTLALDLGTSVNCEPVHNSFRIFNHGLGTLRGQIRADRTWLVLDRTSFTCPTGHSVEVRVQTDLEEFPQTNCQDEAQVAIESNGGPAELSVYLATTLAPVVVGPEYVPLHPAPLDQPATARLVLKNEGLANAHVQLEASHSGLQLSRTVCDIKPGKSVRIAVQWDQGLPTSGQPVHIALWCDDRLLRNIPIHWEQEPDTTGL